MLYLLLLLFGASLSFAFAPYGPWLLPLSYIAPAILLNSWQQCSAKQAAKRGLVFGVGFFGTGVSWVYISIHTYGNTHALIALTITALFVLLLSLFPMLTGFLFKTVFPRTTFLQSTLSFALCWTAMELLRGWIFTGFPWLHLGYTQLNSPLRGFAPIIGVYGLSLLTCCISGCLAWLWQQRPHLKNLVAIVSLVSVLFIAAYQLNQHHWTQAQGKAIKVSLVQGNVPQELKWDPDLNQKTLADYMALTEKHWDSDVIIWPEAAIPIPLPYADDWLAKLDKSAKQNSTSLLVGIPVLADDGKHYYNAIIGLGNANGRYYKRHLVIFGEFVPLEKYLRGLLGILNVPMSNFTSGPKQQKPLRLHNTIEVAPLVCYEIAFLKETYRTLPEANMLVTISNDAWFGRSNAAAQHLQMAQMRSLETGRYGIFATNTGITAFIKPDGTIQSQLPMFEQAVLTDTIYAMQGNTPILSLF